MKKEFVIRKCSNCGKSTKISQLAFKILMEYYDNKPPEYICLKCLNKKANKHIQSEKKKKYYQENKDRIKKKSLEYYRKNRKKYLKIFRKNYDKTHPNCKKRKKKISA